MPGASSGVWLRRIRDQIEQRGLFRGGRGHEVGGAPRLHRRVEPGQPGGVDLFQLRVLAGEHVDPRRGARRDRARRAVLDGNDQVGQPLERAVLGRRQGLRRVGPAACRLRTRAGGLPAPPRDRRRPPRSASGPVAAAHRAVTSQTLPFLISSARYSAVRQASAMMRVGRVLVGVADERRGVGDEEVLHLVRLTVLVEHARLRIVAHAHACPLRG